MNTACSHCNRLIPRREFLAKTLLTSAATGLASNLSLRSLAAEKGSIPIVVFSKAYQELKLSFEDAAVVTTEAGLAGVDCPVRPGGEGLPERVTGDLTRYGEALRKHELSMALI